ncbi:sigma 54-interacting transcriptional regulator [Anaerosacchariphilus sp. NSJ-68]|uniref:Sigma 54-interacting transcriptional regulator n=2 Tax=Lachnospiraceae TaxID=186803 RepID=A0A923L9C9_9FIRM|nr:MULTISPECIES: sigma 54-interacting transcriptional regulator [Lachnospiraceae]MBC5658216.1 sigma 54-interacting transcriptional regulator [Anaerosacchariphilus hominis]MBC5698577.1 sigma 54-interacting transcriptional regulator [Roseburia difficilis]
MSEREILELVEIAGEKGIDARTAAEKLGIWQQEAAELLARLVKEGKLIKKGRSPIRYFIEPDNEKENKEEPFSCIIGNSGSLAVQIQLAKAAVCYPPYGLHTLLLGATGVGKTMLAREIWKYSVKERGKNIPFVSLNCAEYADNPQLLLSQLFGHEKGAFTGADFEKEGLIDQADEGILFLDEIHRLSPTGQEILFSVIDHGEFRRLGGIQNHHVSVMILGATTEDPQSALLKTFKRRIPVAIQLPTLEERPIRERFLLVSQFFMQEARRTGIPIHVSKNVLEYLVLFESDGNIGDLKNEVLLTCAYGYLEKNGKQKEEPIYVNSRIISRGSRTIQVKPELREMLEEVIPKEGKLYDPKQIIAEISEPALQESAYLETLNGKETVEEARKALFHYVSPDIYEAAEELLADASEKFNVSYTKNVENSLAFFLQQIISYARVGRGLMEQADHLMEEKYNRERRFVEQHTEWLRKSLKIEITKGEAATISFLLAQHHEEQGKVGLLVAAYGEQVASSQADLAGQLLPDTPVAAVDFSLDKSFSEFKKELISAINRANSGKGVILCTDINLLLAREAELSEWSGVECRILPAVNTALLLEICKWISQDKMNVEEISRQGFVEYRNYVESLFGKQSSEIPEKKSVIIAYCITGTGSAKITRRLLLENPDISKMADIIPLGITSDLPSIARKLGNRLRLVVGFLDPQLPGVPFVGLDSVFSSEGIRRILFYLRDFGKEQKKEPEIALDMKERLILVDRNIHNIAPSLDEKKAAEQARYVLEKIMERYEKKPEADFAVRVYIHVIAMFERLAVREKLEPMLQFLDESEKSTEKFRWLSQILKAACDELKLQLDDMEVYYFLIVIPEK